MSRLILLCYYKPIVVSARVKTPFSVIVSFHLLQEALKKPENLKRLRGIHEILARKAAREAKSGGHARERKGATRSARSEIGIRVLLDKLFKA